VASCRVLGYRDVDGSQAAAPPKEGERVLHKPIDHDRVVIYLWPDDPVDDGNALVGVWHALLIEAGVVALIVLLFWLF
jgi:hypothetical protein